MLKHKIFYSPNSYHKKHRDSSEENMDLNPNISMYVVHTVLHIFSLVMTRSLQSSSNVICRSLTFFSQPSCLIEQSYEKEKLNICHS